MEAIHAMKARLATELEETCEDMLCKSISEKHLEMITLTSKAIISLHEACRVIKKMQDYEGKSMDEHYK